MRCSYGLLLLDFRFRNFSILSMKDGLEVTKSKSDDAKNQSKTFAEYLAKNFKST